MKCLCEYVCAYACTHTHKDPSFSWWSCDPICSLFKRKCLFFPLCASSYLKFYFSFINIDGPGLLTYLAVDLLKLIFRSRSGDLFQSFASASLIQLYSA